MIKIYRNILYILISLFSLTTFAQQEEVLKEIIIDKLSREQMIELINNVRNQTYKNYVPEYHKYRVKHWAQMNDSVEIISTDEMYQVALDYKAKKIHKSVVASPTNKVKNDTLFFNRYSFNDSPYYWLTEFVMRKFVNIPFLDFFNHFDDYQYSRSRKGNITRIDFYSQKAYDGFFTFNEKFQILELQFELLTPYPINHSQTQNRKLKFEKNWLYKKENVHILLDLDRKNKLFIEKLTVEERIENYNFRRFDSNGKLIMEDRDLNFDSKLIFEKL